MKVMGIEELSPSPPAFLICLPRLGADDSQRRVIGTGNSQWLCSAPSTAITDLEATPARDARTPAWKPKLRLKTTSVSIPTKRRYGRAGERPV